MPSNWVTTCLEYLPLTIFSMLEKKKKKKYKVHSSTIMKRTWSHPTERLTLGSPTTIKFEREKSLEVNSFNIHNPQGKLKT